MTTDDLRQQCDETDRLTAELRKRNNPGAWLMEWAELHADNMVIGLDMIDKAHILPS